MYNLIYNDNSIISFKYPINKVVELDGLLLVLLDTPAKENYNENVLCIRSDGSIAWQIEKTRAETEDSPYVNIYIQEEKLIAVNYDSWKEEVDIRSGKIIKSFFAK